MHCNIVSDSNFHLVIGQGISRRIAGSVNFSLPAIQPNRLDFAHRGVIKPNPTRKQQVSFMLCTPYLITRFQFNCDCYSVHCHSQASRFYGRSSPLILSNLDGSMTGSIFFMRSVVVWGPEPPRTTQRPKTLDVRHDVYLLMLAVLVLVSSVPV